MKKLLTSVLSLAMIATMAGCGGDTAKNSTCLFSPSSAADEEVRLDLCCLRIIKTHTLHNRYTQLRLRHCVALIITRKGIHTATSYTTLLEHRER